MTVALALASCGASPDHVPTGSLSGIYSDVSLSYETGDVGGIEIDVHAEGPEPYAEFVWCEGWCNRSYRVPIEVKGDGFSFAYSEEYFDESGDRVATNANHMHATLTNKGLVLRGRGEGDVPLDPRLLPRREQRFGLNVAGGSMNKPGSEHVP